MLESIMAGNDATFVAALEELVGDSDSDLVAKVRKFAGERKSKLVKVHKAEGKFLTILHNDAWCNNFMFKQVLKKVKEKYNFDIRFCFYVERTLREELIKW